MGYREKSPMDILKFSQKSDLDNKLKIDISNVDPLNFLRMQVINYIQIIK